MTNYELILKGNLKINIDKLSSTEELHQQCHSIAGYDSEAEQTHVHVFVLGNSSSD